MLPTSQHSAAPRGREGHGAREGRGTGLRLRSDFLNRAVLADGIQAAGETGAGTAPTSARSGQQCA